MSIGDFLEIMSQTNLVGIILVRRLGGFLRTISQARRSGPLEGVAYNVYIDMCIYIYIYIYIQSTCSITGVPSVVPEKNTARTTNQQPNKQVPEYKCNIIYYNTV